MTSVFKTLLESLGFLRLSLLLLALANALIPFTISLLRSPPAGPVTASAWETYLGIVAPVMAPLFIVVIFFDYVMSRIRAADTEGALQNKFRAISRIELILIGFMILLWLPFFMTLGS